MDIVEPDVAARRERLRERMATVRAGGADDLDQLTEQVEGDVDAAAAALAGERRSELLRTLVHKRRELKFSQGFIADRMGTTQSAVSDLERGQTDPRLSTLQRYAEALDMRLDLAVLSKAMPVVDERMAGDVWRLIESRGQGRILARLIDQTRTVRSLQDLAKYAAVPVPVAETLVRHLIEHNWTRRTSQGLVELNAARKAVVGISVRQDHVVGVLTDLLTSEALSGPIRFDLPGRTPKPVVETINYLSDRLREKAGEVGQEVLGLGVTLAGRIDRELGSTLTAPDLQEGAWQGISLQGDLAERNEGLLVVVGNDANALAVREYLHDSDPAGLFLVLLSASGRGIGAGIVQNGFLVQGAYSAAGEVGHTPISSATPHPKVQSECRCGVAGCLERAASELAIVEALDGATDGAVRSLTDAAAALARAADPQLIEPIARAGAAVGNLITSTIRLLDPARIVLCGPPILVESATQLSVGDIFMTSLYAEVSRLTGKAGQVVVRPNAPELEPLAAASLAVKALISSPEHWLHSMEERVSD